MFLLFFLLWLLLSGGVSRTDLWIWQGIWAHRRNSIYRFVYFFWSILGDNSLGTVDSGHFNR